VDLFLSATTDLQIAAIAIEYNAVIFTHATDFSRISGVRTQNPLK
jgi:predicted nucleic acid-binding protein